MCRSPEHGSQYPFVLKLVSKDGLTCSQCPWYEFCIGCPLPCDESPLGRTSGYIAVDWDNTTLHLKYQSAQERVSSYHYVALIIIPSAPGACQYGESKGH